MEQINALIKFNDSIHFDLLSDSEPKIRAHFFLLNSYLSIFVSAEKYQNQNNNRKIWREISWNHGAQKKPRTRRKAKKKPSQGNVKKTTEDS